MRKNIERCQLNDAPVAGLGVVFLAFGIDNRLNQIEVSPGDMGRNSDAAAVRCQGFVEVDGSLTDYHCVTDEIQMEGDYYAQRKVVAAVIHALPEQTFEPAMIRGEEVRVLMNFSIFVQCSPESCQTTAAPHHGYLLQKYGPNYVAPQPILADDDWYVGFDYKLKWIRDWMPDIARVDDWPDWDRIPYTLAVEIDVDGAPHDQCLHWFKRVPNLGFVNARRALERARDSIGAVSYIPGFYDSQPVSMRLHERSVLSDDPDSRIGGMPQTDCQPIDQATDLQD